jgi:ribose 5-phosphate isomerase A
MADGSSRYRILAQEVLPVVSDLKQLKIEAARAALGEVRSGMRLGLGTGSTAEELVRLLGASIGRGELTGVVCTSTSESTARLAESLGIRMARLEELGRLDLAIDGADEIDPRLRLIKGRGGALLREKIVEQSSERFIVIADHTKEVDRLGAGPLPVEVVCFATTLLRSRFEERSWNATVRLENGTPFITDEGHHILDLTVPPGIDIADFVSQLRELAGVVETGFFPTEATEAIIASAEGVRRRGR